MLLPVRVRCGPGRLAAPEPRW